MDNETGENLMKRLDKILSDAGVAARRELKGIIKAGRVTVDGVVVREADRKIDETTAVITMDGEPIAAETLFYYMMNKPAGVLTATEDREQKTVLDLLPENIVRQGVFPVGRLDKDTTGLLLLTNDGDFAHQVVAPKSHVAKVYEARTDGIADESDALRFREGIVLRDGTKCLPAALRCTGTDICYVTVMEGKYHQVKRMLAACGKPVQTLRRLSIGQLELDPALEPGSVRPLRAEELTAALTTIDL